MQFAKRILLGGKALYVGKQRGELVFPICRLLLLGGELHFLRFCAGEALMLGFEAFNLICQRVLILLCGLPVLFGLGKALFRCFQLGFQLL